MVWNFRSLKLSFPGTFAPWDPMTFVHRYVRMTRLCPSLMFVLQTPQAYIRQSLYNHHTQDTTLVMSYGRAGVTGGTSRWSNSLPPFGGEAYCKSHVGGIEDPDDQIAMYCTAVSDSSDNEISNSRIMYAMYTGDLNNSSHVVNNINAILNMNILLVTVYVSLIQARRGLYDVTSYLVCDWLLQWRELRIA